MLFVILFAILTILSSCFALPVSAHADESGGGSSGTDGSLLSQPITDTQDLLSDARPQVLKNIEHVKESYGFNVWVVVEPSVAKFSDDFTLEDWCQATAKTSGFGKDDVLLVIETARHDMAVWVGRDSEYFGKQQAQNELNVVSGYLIEDNLSAGVLRFTTDVEKSIRHSQDLSPYIIVGATVFLLVAILAYGWLSKSKTTKNTSIAKVKLNLKARKISKDIETANAAVNVSAELIDDLKTRALEISTEFEQLDETNKNVGSIGAINNGFLQMIEKSSKGLTDKITKSHVINKYLHLSPEIQVTPPPQSEQYQPPIHDESETIPVVNASTIPETTATTESSNNNSIYSDYYTHSYSRETYGSYYHSDDNKKHDEDINARLLALDREVNELMRGTNSTISTSFKKDQSNIKKYYDKEEKKAARKENKEKRQFNSRFKF